ncbi:MAG TPA: hypothetical protein VLL52_11440, partial [Anaerolineae bacterium]|nr:hypothetical protein [Anaerolineae bacterium]
MTSFDTTLTVINTASIQTYIFASNQLRENIGASHLAHLATTHWVEDALNELLSAPNRHNYQVQAAEKDRQRQTPLYTNTAIEALQKDGQLCAEVIYSGGGNALILFAGANHDKKAQEFVYQLSRRVLLEAPGLQIYAGHHAYLWQDADQSLHHLITTINQQVIQKQQSQAPTYLPQLSLGVNATCTSTGLPAHGPHPDPAPQGV